MSELKDGGPTEAAEQVKLVLDEWGEGLAQVLESMAEQRPEVSWKPAEAPAEGSPELLWWEQPFQIAPELTLWVGATAETWEHLGTITLKAAGLEEVEAGEARNTWFEIVGQSLGGMARSIGSVVGSEVACGTGLEHAPGAGDLEWYSVSLTFPEKSLAPLSVAVRPSLAAALSAARRPSAPAERDLPESSDAEPAEHGHAPNRSRTMDLLLDVDLPVSISFGKTRIPLKDVLKLTTGSIVELNRGIDDPVEVLVNHCLIARGEVVVVEGNYGVRIHEIASRHERLNSLR